MDVPYRADHVGSFLRPAKLLEARQGSSPEELRTLEDEQIRRVLAKQKEIGFDYELIPTQHSMKPCERIMRVYRLQGVRALRWEFIFAAGTTAAIGTPKADMTPSRRNCSGHSRWIGSCWSITTNVPARLSRCDLSPKGRRWCSGLSAPRYRGWKIRISW